MPVTRGDTVRGRLGAILWDTDELGTKDVNGRYITTDDKIVYPLIAGSLDTFIWTCRNGIWVVADVVEAHTVIGGAGATVQVVVCPQSVAIASGVAQLTGAFDLNGVAAPAVRFGTKIATPTPMTRGDSLGLDFSGTLTALVGNITVYLERIG